MNWFQKIILFLTGLSTLALLISYSSMLLSPKIFWWVSFFGLAYLPVLCVFLLFTLYWFFAKKKVFYFLLIILLIGYKAHANTFALHVNNSNKEEQTSYKILTWNVKGLDAYNPKVPLQNRDAIIQEIAEAKADIICLQEFNTYQNESKEKSNLQTLLQETGLPYYHYYRAYENKKETRSFGVIIFSKFPIKHTGVVSYQNTSKLNSTIYADLEIENSIVRVYSAHLQSTQLTHKDLAFVDQVDNSETDFDSERVIGKLNNAFQMRALQADSVANSIAVCKYPLIVCGDFNDTPVSYTYRKISSGLQDAFLKRGRGIGSTFIDLPFLRIDYSLFSEDYFEIQKYEKIKTKLSDHYPSLTTFSINRTSN